MSLTKPSARNKVGYMKKLWRPWCDLRFKVTGAGWDPATGLVTLPDEWWEEKKNEKDDKFYQLRKKGVAPELSELWDDVFVQVVARGKNVISPTMDPVTAPIGTQCESQLLLGNVDAIRLEDDEYNLDDEDNLNTLAAKICEPVLFDTLVESRAIVGTDTEIPSKEIIPSEPSGVKKNPLEVKLKRYAVLDTLKAHMKLVGNTGKKMLSLMEEDMAITTQNEWKNIHNL